jgi:hypothetical protein
MIPRSSIKVLASVVTALAGLLFGLTTSHASNEPVVGTWHGTFHCGNTGNTGSAFTLTFEEGSGGLLAGEFRFSAPDGRGAAGAYRIRGRYTPDDRSFTVVPGEWIERPSGWRAAGITGSIHENGLTMTGAIRGCASRAGNIEFRADRDGVPLTPDGTPAVMVDLPTPPTGGPFEGHWRGAIACNGFDIEITLDMIQDGVGVVAVAMVSTPTSRAATTHVDSRQIMPGTATSDGLLLTGLNRASFRSLDLPRVIRELDLRLADEDRIDGAVKRLEVPSNWRCQTVALRRDGPARTPSGADKPDLVGTWAGLDSGQRPGAAPLAADHSMTSQAEIIIADDGGRLYGTFSAARPVNREAALQDRFATSIRPLLVLEDGRLAFVSVAVKREEGTFARNRPYLGAAFLLALTRTGDGGLAVERFDRSNSSSGMVLQPMGEAAIAGLLAGEGPPLPLPTSILGTVGEAVTLDGQCRALSDWMGPVVAVHDLQRMQISAGMQVVLPLFDDPAFLPAFGIPFGLTTEEERRAVWELTRLHCPRRIGLRSEMAIEYALRRDFDLVVGMLSDRQETGIWHDGVMAEIDLLADDPSGLDRLAQIETDMELRGDEIPAKGRAALTSTIAAKRDQIAVAAILKRADEMASWPDEIATLDKLTELAVDANAVPLPSEALSDLLQGARAKADAIITPPIEAAITAAAAAPATLDGLSEVTRIQRDIHSIVARLDPALGAADAMERARPLHEIRMGLINNEQIQRSFHTRLGAIETSQDAARSVESVARQYLDEAHFRGVGAIPAYAQAVAAATATLEIRSIRFADHSTSATEGEPTAEELLIAVKVQFDQINQELSSSFGRCQRGEFRNDPIMALECLAILTAGGGGEFRMWLTRFEKLGCAGAVGHAGFICDYVLGFQANSPFMQGRMEELIGAGSVSQGRFVQVDGGWLFTRIR